MCVRERKKLIAFVTKIINFISVISAQLISVNSARDLIKLLVKQYPSRSSYRVFRCRRWLCPRTRLIIRHTGRKPVIITDRQPRLHTTVEWSTRRKWRTPSKRIWQRTPRRPPKRRIIAADIPGTRAMATITSDITALITDHRRRSATTDEWWIRRKWLTPRPRIWPPTPRRSRKSLICRISILTRTPSGESSVDIINERSFNSSDRLFDRFLCWYITRILCGKI